MPNALSCSISPWRGDNEKCRWCNLYPVRGGWRFCSKLCIQGWADNHYYWRGRIRILDRARGDCPCPDPITPGLGYFDGHQFRYMRYQKPHIICICCGECEEKVIARDDKMSVNHIDPRNGIPMSQADCIHHLSNMEVMCWRCHAELNKLGNDRAALFRWIRGIK